MQSMAFSHCMLTCVASHWSSTRIQDQAESQPSQAYQAMRSLCGVPPRSFAQGLSCWFQADCCHVRRWAIPTGHAIPTPVHGVPERPHQHVRPLHTTRLVGLAKCILRASIMSVEESSCLSPRGGICGGTDIRGRE
ncbi:uncharacterized protein BDV14DRAFT_175441 [Aspergillus stella-maris]|uniref:uncharacterized protein n=1 Tax=Aspergillus stella-maris TaxID=1810926 RepID=UPI003CCCFF70